MEKRRQQIVDLVNRQGEINFTVLKENFPGVSEVTLRKDLRFLDEEQQLIRVHGGAKSVQTAVPGLNDYYFCFTQHAEEKQLIGQKFAKLVKPGDAFFMAAGSTCGAAAKALPNIPLQVFTDGMEVAMNLSRIPNVEANILGGTVEPDTMRVIGGGALAELSRMKLDYAVIGTSSYTEADGFSCHSAYYGVLTQLLRQKADKMVVLMDSSKARPLRTARYIPATEVDMVISDGKLPEDVVAGLERQGVTVL